jgi:DNA-directed RNA polymerase specialized sigma24 family protein
MLSLQEVMEREERQSLEWLDGLAVGSQLAVEASWHRNHHPLRFALKPMFDRSSLARTAFHFTVDEVLLRAYDRVRASPPSLVEHCGASRSDPAAYLWTAWLETSERVLRETGELYEQVWGAGGLVRNLTERGTLARYARRRLGAPRLGVDDASDVVGEAVVKLLKTASKEDGNCGEFRRMILDGPPLSKPRLSLIKSVLFRATSNAATDHLRRRGRRKLEALGDSDVALPDVGIDRNEELFSQLLRAFSKLSRPERKVAAEILRLRKRASGSVPSLAEIAATLGQATVEVKRIIRKLQRSVHSYVQDRPRR